ncbi:MAG: S1 RNA-binding domain-containing protein [Chloroflexi bacterium]|nr:S1 RNA-binding domain-containing protein [Chloroflexota bacterium]
MSDQETKVKVIPRKRVVVKLARGMKLTGKVRRVTNFGAFVDIGVNTDGLVHISELAPYRVAKVTDVVNVGDEVTVWIKDLNKAENRISLTMIPPGTKTIRDLQVGDIVKGTVTRIEPYGAFVDIGIGRDALLRVREMAEGYVRNPEDIVQVGEELEARVIRVDVRRNQVDLSLKGLREEAEEPQAVEQELPEALPEEEEEEIVSPFEIAFLEAQAQKERRREKRRKKKRWEAFEDDEIIRRTLEYADKSS